MIYRHISVKLCTSLFICHFKLPLKRSQNNDSDIDTPNTRPDKIVVMRLLGAATIILKFEPRSELPLIVDMSASMLIEKAQLPC